MAGSFTLLSAACALASLVQATSPAYPLFAHPLPIPEIATPSKSFNIDGTAIDYYEVDILPFQKQVYPNLGKADMVGYNGLSPGPTFMIERFTQTVIRYQNKQTRNSSVHLHGSDTHSPWDGWADDTILPGQFKDYYYPNDHMARPIWYHDHADHVTATNAYSGLGGVYIIYDPAEDALGLPSGSYDVPLTLTDRMYDSAGNLQLPDEEGYNTFGDVMEVNAQPWPYFEVEPRKYRLRIFDMSISRPYDLYFVDENGDRLSFQVIGSDCGLFGAPVTSQDLQVAMGERYEIVFDFASYKGKNVTMKNNVAMPDIQNYGNTQYIMQFIVGNTVNDTSNNGDVPSTLSTDIQWPDATTDVSHVFNFEVGGDARWTINGVDYDDVNNRVLARPEQGTTELWEVKYAGGPGVHPVHVHLVSFQIVSRTGGSRGLLPYEKAGLKDIVLLEPGESAQILANYGPWNGLFMFHCHNLIHEDNAMMAVFNVSKLEGMGYDMVEDLADPADARFASQDYDAALYEDEAISSTVSMLAALHAYETSTMSQATSGGMSPASSAAHSTASEASATTTSVGTTTRPASWLTSTLTSKIGTADVIQVTATAVVSVVETTTVTA